MLPTLSNASMFPDVKSDDFYDVSNASYYIMNFEPNETHGPCRVYGLVDPKTFWSKEQETFLINLADRATIELEEKFERIYSPPENWRATSTLIMSRDILLRKWRSDWKKDPESRMPTIHYINGHARVGQRYGSHGEYYSCTNVYWSTESLFEIRVHMERDQDLWSELTSVPHWNPDLDYV